MLDPAFDHAATAVPPGPLALESILLGELAHRTVNDFSSAAASIHLLRRAASMTEAAQPLARLADQLHAFGTIQRLLQAPDHRGAMDLSGRVEELCSAMASARFTESGIMLHLEADDIVIESARGWRIMMILAELLVNAARHAFDAAGGSVRVRLLCRGLHVICEVHDDGHGRVGPGSARWGYGSSVVHLLTAQIAAEMRMISSSAGTSIEIMVPRPFAPRRRAPPTRAGAPFPAGQPAASQSQTAAQC